MCYIINLFSNTDILANRHSESKILSQNKDKEPLYEPDMAFILWTQTKSDVSDHGGSVFTAWISLRLPDVWWCRMIKVIEKTLRLICMCLSCAEGVIQGCIWIKEMRWGKKEKKTGKCKLPPTLPFATDWCCENRLIKAGGRKLYKQAIRSEMVYHIGLQCRWINLSVH